MCGKHGCWGPHSSAASAGPSVPIIDVLFEDIAGPMPLWREVFEALCGRWEVPSGLYGL